MRRDERSAECGGLLLLAVEALGEQLEVGQHARQRRAQLVRGVGDELALAAQRVLGLAARGVERVEHPVERARELGDLVVGLDRGDAAAGSRVRSILRAVAVSAAIGAIARRGDHQPGQQRQPGAAEHADDEEQAHAADGRLDDGQRAGVLEVDAARDDGRRRRAGSSRVSTR